MDTTLTPDTQTLLDAAAGFEERLIEEAREREAAAEAGDENGNKGGEVPRRSTSVSRDESTIVNSQPAPAKTMEPPRRSEERERDA